MKFEDVKAGQVLYSDTYLGNLRGYLFVESITKEKMIATEIIEGDAYGEWFMKKDREITVHHWTQFNLQKLTLVNKKEMFRVIFTDMEYVYEE